MLEILAQTATGTSNLASTTITFTNNNVTGNSIIVACGNTSGTASDVSGVTDSQGNVYVKALATANVLLGEVEIWYTSGIKGGANVITVAYTTGVACAVIAREYYGTVYASVLDKFASNTGNSNTLSSGPTSSLTQNYELIVGVGIIPLADTFTAGANFVNLVTLAAPLTITMAMEDLFVASGGTQTATFGSNASIQWVCAVATFFLLPTGTTTSTSSTSASTFSTSSTSSSISSTSVSISSTSTSVSTSSTSTSQSTTSSSISSTSSSTSSTSMSSTSSSTSISSTSSSISSTSISSTSMSSTSSSTSISSTSSSISSTSSSISSTSSSVSSTSQSSTSSSISTSTTTLPPLYNSFSYVDTPTLINTVSVVQRDSGADNNGVNGDVVGVFGSPNTAGNSIIVCVTLALTSNTGIAKPVDTLKNTYTQIADFSNGSTFAGQRWWIANNINGGTNTVTCNPDPGACNIHIWEVNGLGTVVLDRSSKNFAASGTALTSNATAPIQAYQELLLGVFCVDANDTYTLGAGYSNLVTQANTGFSSASEEQVVSTLGNYTATMTASTSTSSLSALLTFRGVINNAFTIPNYSNASGDDGDYFIERGSKYLIREYKNQHTNNTDIIKFTWKGRSTISTLVSPILIQIFNVSTQAWETLANQTLVPADTDFSVTVTQSTSVANYYDATNVVTFRSYQLVV